MVSRPPRTPFRPRLRAVSRPHPAPPRPPGSGTRPADRCREAVIRAFRELSARGQPDSFAFDAALAVFHWHHPEVSDEAAGTIVASWLRCGPAH